VDNAVSGQGLQATFAAGSNALTLTRIAGGAGAGSTVSIGDSTYLTKAVNTSSLTDTAGAPTALLTITGGANDQLTMAVDGGPSVTITLAAGGYSDAGGKATFLGDLATKIAGSSLAGTVN